MKPKIRIRCKKTSAAGLTVETIMQMQRLFEADRDISRACRQVILAKMRSMP